MSGQVSLIPRYIFREKDTMTTPGLNLVLDPVLSINGGAITFRELAPNLVEGNVKILAAATTVVWPMSVNREDQFAKLVLDQNVILDMQGLAAGMSGVLIVEMGGSGGYTLTLPAGSKIDGGTYTPTPTAGTYDQLLFWYHDELLWKPIQNFT